MMCSSPPIKHFDRWWLPAIAVLCLARAGYATGASHDPEQLAAEYLATEQVPACAAVRLLADEQDYEVDANIAESVLQWLWDYEQLNRFNRADRLSRILEKDWDIPQHNVFWLEQVQSMRNRGELSNVEHALRRLRDPLNPKMARERNLLLGGALLQQQRHAEAAEVLEAVAGESNSSPYDRYNLALALIGQGNTAAQGRKLLDELSQQLDGNAVALALRDRVNLVLGWSWLAAQKGGSARPYFKRVRLQSPDASMALLGMGWAELAPNGGPQFVPVFMGFYHEFAFEPAATGVERFTRALKPWQVLKQRPVHEPPVQEALQAIAYTYAMLKRTEAAVNAYRHAIHQYQNEISRLIELEDGLRSSTSDPRHIIVQRGLSGEFTKVVTSQGFIQAEAEAEMLEACGAELQSIRVSTEPYQRPLLAHLEQQTNRLRQAERVIMNELRQHYVSDISQRRRRLQGYLANASFALARLQDRRSTH